MKEILTDEKRDFREQEMERKDGKLIQKDERKKDRREDSSTVKCGKLDRRKIGGREDGVE